MEERELMRHPDGSIESRVVKLVEVNVNLNSGRAIVLKVPEVTLQMVVENIATVGFVHRDPNDETICTRYPVTSINNVNYREPTRTTPPSE